MATALPISIGAIPPINIQELTTGAFEGDGVFDQLMRAAKTHVENEFTKGRLKGLEYATVYLGMLEQVLNGSVQFLTVGRKAALEALLVQKQIELADVQKEIALQELEIAKLNVTKVPFEIEKLKAEGELLKQQGLNAIEEREVTKAQVCKLKAEFDLIAAQIIKAGEEGALIAAKVATENAQTKAMGVDSDSVIGRQKALYQAQTDGFKRDAEQKAAEIS